MTNKCICILQRGKRAGQECGLTAQPGSRFCKRHHECVSYVKRTPSKSPSRSYPKTPQWTPPRTPKLKRPRKSPRRSPVASGMKYESYEPFPRELKLAVREFYKHNALKKRFQPLFDALAKHFPPNEIEEHKMSIYSYAKTIVGYGQLKAGLLSDNQIEWLEKYVLKIPLETLTKRSVKIAFSKKFGKNALSKARWAIDRVTDWLAFEKGKVLKTLAECKICKKQKKERMQRVLDRRPDKW